MNDIRTLIRIVESELDEASFVHYSTKDLPVGAILTGQGARWWRGEWAAVLERYRPKDMIPLAKAVFMFDAFDDPGHRAVGGDERRFRFEVKPLGPVEKHDARWAFDLDAVLNGYDEDGSIEEYAANYWNGVESEEPMWEYLTTRAEIVDKQSLE